MLVLVQLSHGRSYHARTLILGEIKAQAQGRVCARVVLRFCKRPDGPADNKKCATLFSHIECSKCVQVGTSFSKPPSFRQYNTTLISTLYKNIFFSLL